MTLLYMLVFQQFFILIMGCDLHEMIIHINMEYILYSLTVSTFERRAELTDQLFNDERALETRRGKIEM